MSNRIEKDRRPRTIFLAVLGFMLAMMLGLSHWGPVSEAAAAPIEPLNTFEKMVIPPAQEGEDDEPAFVYPVVNPVEAAKDRQVLFEEMTLVHLIAEGQDEFYIQTACAGNGLNNVEPAADGPKVLIPNAGDLVVDGSNVAIKLESNGQISFIPRVQGQLIGLVTGVDENGGAIVTEVPSLSLAEAEELLAAGRMVWTAKGQGPFGTGHGLAGHIANCDPTFNDDVYDDYLDQFSNDEDDV